MNAIKTKFILISQLLITILSLFLSLESSAKESLSILNVSYDPTRELFREINHEFSEQYFKQYGLAVKIKQSHGGSVKQANAVINGLKADVVSLATVFDVEMIAGRGLIEPNWKTKFPNESSPYFSTIVFLVRKDNPKQIKDWDDLVRNDVTVISSNPKTSGGAIWNYLAALGYASQKYKDEQKTIEFINKLFSNVPIFDISARNATISFTERRKGDVLITWENEALLVSKNLKPHDYEIIYPSKTILVNLPVTMVTKVAEAHNSKIIAERYIDFLYSKLGQNIIGKNYFRPIDKKILAEFDYFNNGKDTKYFSLEDIGDWKNIKAKHFDEGGVFDKIYTSRDLK